METQMKMANDQGLEASLYRVGHLRLNIRTKKKSGAADLDGLVAAIVAMVDRIAREAEDAAIEELCSHANLAGKPTDQ